MASSAIKLSRKKYNNEIAITDIRNKISIYKFVWINLYYF